jgi:hypothetical protein
MIPAGIAQSGNKPAFYVWILVGFSVLIALEQLLNWRPRPRAGSKGKRKPSHQHRELPCVHIRSSIDAAYQSGSWILKGWNRNRAPTGFVFLSTVTGLKP